METKKEETSHIDRRAILVTKKNNLERERDKIKNEKRLYRILAGLCGATALVFWLAGNGIILNIVASILLLFGFLFQIASFAISFFEQENEIKRIDNEIDYLDKKPSEEGKAEQLFTSHQIELKKYYDLTLYQNKAIFYIGGACIFIGFVFVGVTIYFILQPTTMINGTDKILISAVGTLSTFLSNFVGAIFLKMYAGTLKALTEFHSRLVTTHHLHFGNYLSTTIKNSDLRDKSIADLIIRMSGSKTDL